jgi:hypothetical protein
MGRKKGDKKKTGRQIKINIGGRQKKRWVIQKEPFLSNRPCG